MKRLKRSVKKVFRQKSLGDLFTVVAFCYMMNLCMLYLDMFKIPVVDVAIFGAISGFMCLVGTLGILFEYKEKYETSHILTCSIGIQLLFEILLIAYFVI